ncbi:MAG: 30S ribosomal protein S6 [Deltaproteobacteria bacterium]|jgi:small subunit ribosomal protein S6
MSEALGNLREYETVFVVNPELTEDALNSDVLDRLKGVLEKKGAELLREDVWGKKKMAFEVNKNPRGNYILFHYVGTVGVVEELERIMRNAEHVSRFMTTLHGDVADVNAKRAEVEKMVEERAQKAREEAERAAKEAAEGGEEE